MDYQLSHAEAIDQATNEPTKLPRSHAEVIRIIVRCPRRSASPRMVAWSERVEAWRASGRIDGRGTGTPQRHACARPTARTPALLDREIFCTLRRPRS